MKASFFQANRVRLREATADSIVVLSGYRSMQRSNDATFLFEQEANFWWLTGIEAPDWKLVINGFTGQTYLIAPDVDKIHQTFDGSLDWNEAKRISGVDEVISAKDGGLLLTQYAEKYEMVFTLGKDPSAKRYDFNLNSGPVALFAWLKKRFDVVVDCRLDLARLRAIKQPEEVQAIRQAIALTVNAFEKVKPQLKSFKYEYQVEAEFSYYFRSHGAKGHAYDPIVASGKNACTLHYIANQGGLERDQLLLLDIGARVNGYAADITRTYAVGQPTQRQREVHKAVESAHQQIIALLKPGLRIDAYAKNVDEIMKAALAGLGLLKSTKDYRKYFPHAVSHGLGVGVHDALGKPTEFLPGMVLTVEPGIYIPEEGIGVRVEDDILITKTGHENLSAALKTSL